jgi:hypothetical protein
MVFYLKLIFPAPNKTRAFFFSNLNAYKSSMLKPPMLLHLTNALKPFRLAPFLPFLWTALKKIRIKK